MPNRTAHAGFTNAWALGSETGQAGCGAIYKGNDHIGPFTTTDETTVANPRPPPANIPSPTNGQLIALRFEAKGTSGSPLSGNSAIANPADDDLPGIKFFVRSASFTGGGRRDVDDRALCGVRGDSRNACPRCSSTEPQYRSWALLARWIAEEFLLPRNFPLLPHKLRTNGAGTAGNHGTLTDAATFSAVVLAVIEGLSRSPATFGLPAAPLPPTAASLQAAYAPRRTDPNPRWQSMFNVFRGFHGHGYCGDPVNGDHDCPGPMFDWHRFAREVWDWWWFPFDLDAAAPDAAVAARPYSLATRDGDTPLKEYFWSTPAAVPLGRVRTGIHGAQGTPRRPSS